jgi:hypothetical protein
MAVVMFKHGTRLSKIEVEDVFLDFAVVIVFLSSVDRETGRMLKLQSSQDVHNRATTPFSEVGAVVVLLALVRRVGVCVALTFSTTLNHEHHSRFFSDPLDYDTVAAARRQQVSLFSSPAAIHLSVRKMMPR